MEMTLINVTATLLPFQHVVTLTLIFVAASFQLLANLKGNSATHPRVIGIGNGFDLKDSLIMSV